MTRQERRKMERIAKDLGMKTLISMGFFYEGDGMTIENPVDLIEIFKGALPGYQKAIKKDANELNLLIEQLEICKPLIANNTIDQQAGTIWAMNIYCLTKLGYIKDDNMNGLQYFYTK